MLGVGGWPNPCRRALSTYLDDPTEDNRVALLERYAAIPVHLSLYVVKDLHSLWTVMTKPGEPLLEWPGEPLVTERGHAHALGELREQFRRFHRSSAEWRSRQQADGPEHPQAPTLTIHLRVYPCGRLAVPTSRRCRTTTRRPSPSATRIIQPSPTPTGPRIRLLDRRHQLDRSAARTHQVATRRHQGRHPRRRHEHHWAP